jgi:hypothetical protein
MPLEVSRFGGFILCEALERKQPMHISCKRVAREGGSGGCVGRVAGYAACAPLVSSVGRRQRNRRGGEEREREERRNGIGMGCVCTAVLRAFVPWSVGLPGLSIFARSGPLSKLVAVVVAFVPAI